MTEVIKKIKGWEGRYIISNLGVVKSLLTGKEMKPSITKFGYARVNLRYANCRKFKSYFIHRLVAANFLENPNHYKEVNHIDSNRLNNRVDNLEWCTREENIRHSFKYGNASQKGVRNSNAKLTSEDVKFIRNLIETQKLNDCEIARMFNMASSSIRNIRKRITWSDN